MKQINTQNSLSYSLLTPPRSLSPSRDLFYFVKVLGYVFYQSYETEKKKAKNLSFYWRHYNHYLNIHANTMIHNVLISTKRQQKARYHGFPAIVTAKLTQLVIGARVDVMLPYATCACDCTLTLTYWDCSNKCGKELLTGSCSIVAATFF